MKSKITVKYIEETRLVRKNKDLQDKNGHSKAELRINIKRMKILYVKIKENRKSKGKITDVFIQIINLIRKYL